MIKFPNVFDRLADIFSLFAIYDYKMTSIVLLMSSV